MDIRAARSMRTPFNRAESGEDKVATLFEPEGRVWRFPELLEAHSSMHRRCQCPVSFHSGTIGAVSFAHPGGWTRVADSAFDTFKIRRAEGSEE